MIEVAAVLVVAFGGPPHHLYGRGLRETGEMGPGIFDAFREFRANSLLHRAGSSAADRRGACRPLAVYVATECVLAHRVGNRC